VIDVLRLTRELIDIPSVTGEEFQNRNIAWRAAAAARLPRRVAGRFA
jgi:hypothetical protein